jgi:hypothetical protein
MLFCCLQDGGAFLPLPLRLHDAIALYMARDGLFKSSLLLRSLMQTVADLHLFGVFLEIF